MRRSPGAPSDPSGLPAPAPSTVRAAALVVVIEGVALVATGIVYAVVSWRGRPESLAGAELAAAMALAAGVTLLGLARALRRLRGWSRSPVVVLELVALPVGFSLAFQAHLPQYGLPILALAAGVLGLLATPGSRLAFRE